MAASYTGLAGFSGDALNGSVNTSSGSFTNTPGNQEIGIVTGRLMSSPMLHTPGLDPNNEGNPSSYANYGTGIPPTNQTTAPLPSGLGNYFASDQFVDVYHFRYVVSNLSTVRTLTFSLRNLLAENFTRFVYSNTLWGAQDSTVPPGSISGQSLSTSVTGFSALIPAPGSAALVGLGGLMAIRRRR
jgi:hypothetical protein